MPWVRVYRLSMRDVLWTALLHEKLRKPNVITEHPAWGDACRLRCHHCTATRLLCTMRSSGIWSHPACTMFYTQGCLKHVLHGFSTDTTDSALEISLSRSEHAVPGWHDVAPATSRPGSFADVKTIGSVFEYDYLARNDEVRDKFDPDFKYL